MYHLYLKMRLRRKAEAKVIEQYLEFTDITNYLNGLGTRMNEYEREKILVELYNIAYGLLAVADIQNFTLPQMEQIIKEQVPKAKSIKDTFKHFLHKIYPRDKARVDRLLTKYDFVPEEPKEPAKESPTNVKQRKSDKKRFTRRPVKVAQKEIEEETKEDEIITTDREEEHWRTKEGPFPSAKTWPEHGYCYLLPIYELVLKDASPHTLAEIGIFELSVCLDNDPAFTDFVLGKINDRMSKCNRKTAVDVIEVIVERYQANVNNGYNQAQSIIPEVIVDCLMHLPKY